MISAFFARIQRLLRLRWQALSQDSREFFARLRLPLFLLIAVIVVGTLGYKQFWLEQNSTWLDGFFMTIITITTIGYGEVVPLQTADRLFTVFIAITGIGSLSYIFASSMEFIVARQLNDQRKKRRMERMISELSNHIIVAGYGRMGRWVVSELIAQKERFVIIELGQWHEELHGNNYLHIAGDASDDDVLQQAGIARARSLVAVTSNDATNAFVVMSARALNPELYIIARSESEESISKLKRAGADGVINPYAFGGKRLVQQILYPAVIDFMEHATEWNDELTIEEFVISPDSPFVDKTLRELNLRAKYGINVVALLRYPLKEAPSQASKGVIENHPLIIPTGNDKIHAHDTLIVIGEQQHVMKFDAVVMHR